jgi:hypothetical protein
MGPLAVRASGGLTHEAGSSKPGFELTHLGWHFEHGTTGGTSAPRLGALSGGVVALAQAHSGPCAEYAPDARRERTSGKSPYERPGSLFGGGVLPGAVGEQTERTAIAEPPASLPQSREQFSDDLAWPEREAGDRAGASECSLRRFLRGLPPEGQPRAGESGSPATTRGSAACNAATAAAFSGSGLLGCPFADVVAVYAEWAAQQIVETVGFDTSIARLIRDRDKIYGARFGARVNHLGIEQARIAPRAPWQSGRVVALARVGGLHHRYARAP